MHAASPVLNSMPSFRHARLLLTGVAILSAAPSFGADMKLDVDASQVARRILHAHVQIPVEGGKVVLYYPKWSPGDHAPLGRVDQLTELTFHAGGKLIPWRRNLTDAFTFELDVPPDTHSVEADFDVRLPAPGSPLGGASARIMRLRWDLAMLYPAGKPVQDIAVDATLKVPAGWGYATSLPVGSSVQGKVSFKTVSLDGLVDAPVLTGLNMRSVDLTPGGAVAHNLVIAAESADDLPANADQFGNYARLVAEAKTLFGSEHYRNYQFLVAAGNYTGPGSGFEHGESNDTGVPADFFRKMGTASGIDELLPHEYAHSWSGKYRRPADLTMRDYQQPAQTDLLWVYEGVTAHLGYLLASRSGFWSAEQAREYWACIAARTAIASGRTWRPLQDTADAVPVTMPATFGGYDWNSWVRGLDYYEEGALIWLEAGAIIHQQSGGQRTLDDFLAAFYGGEGGHASVKTYTAQDVFDALARIAPYDWAGFFKARLTSLSAQPPLGGFERSGWRLVYDATPNIFLRSSVLMYTIGLQAGGDGTISDVARGGAPYLAGIVPGMKIVKVNGKDWVAKDFRELLATAKPGQHVELTTEYAGVTQSFTLDAGQGLRYPHLERIVGTPDLLTPYFAPHVAPAATPAAAPAFSATSQ